MRSIGLERAAKEGRPFRGISIVFFTIQFVRVLLVSNTTTGKPSGKKTQE